MQRPFARPHEWLFATGLLMVLCLLLATVAGAASAVGDDVAVTLSPLPDTAGIPTTMSADGQSLLIRGGRDGGAAGRLSFTLPESGNADARWVVWIGRNPVDAIVLHGYGWRSGPQDFYTVDSNRGLLPAGYQFPLPRDWSGDIELELEARGTLRSALRVKVLREDEAMRIEQRGAALSAAIYVSLFTLALLTLALYGAARDRTYLMFFAAAIIAMLSIAADNGHLFQLPVFGLLSWWRGQGVWALGLLLLAAILQLLQRYADSARAVPRLAKYVEIYSLTLVGLAAVALLRLPVFDDWIPVIATPIWVAAAVMAVIVIVEAARRNVYMAWPLATLALAALLAALFSGVWQRGRWIDPIWLRYASQMVLASSAAALAVALISRIGDYRDQRDRHQLARVESEHRMRREVARANLNTSLPAKLRNLDAADVRRVACELLLEHLLPLVPVEWAAVMMSGSQGRDTLVVTPVDRKWVVEDALAQRQLALKRIAANGIALQQAVTAPLQQNSTGIEAILPLPVRAPAWGLLWIQRLGEEGFSEEDMALADEYARVTMQNIDQALATITLRRSAEVDALTGAFNRRTIDQWLARSFTDAARNALPISVLFVDLDRFKAINDKHGHACGDQCLRQVAAALRKVLEDSDLLGRYGGEEFIAILPGRSGANARVIAERLRQAVQDLRIECESKQLQVTVSVGMATRVGSDEAPASAVDRADKALYAAKREGRNCVRVAPAVFN